MAKLVLELSKAEFPVIGALEQRKADFIVTRRPLTSNINELATSANVPQEEFPSCTFRSAADYFEALAVQHLSHLRNQRNDAVDDEADCRKKYIARCLFRKVARDISKEHCQGPFRLYCDDFRPSNILIDRTKLCVTAAIDWEFTYAGPAELTYVAPWWLLLQSPEDWEFDLNEFLSRYTPRLQLFLEALRECEDEQVQENTLLDSQCLSAQMAKSLENGLFWVCLAARYSSMFDDIYWTFIDKIYYGPFTSIEDRIGHLTEDEKRELDGFVHLKWNKQGREFLTIIILWINWLTSHFSSPLNNK